MKSAPDTFFSGHVSRTGVFSIKLWKFRKFFLTTEDDGGKNQYLLCFNQPMVVPVVISRRVYAYVFVHQRFDFCALLWGGEQAYIVAIRSELESGSIHFDFE